MSLLNQLKEQKKLVSIYLDKENTEKFFLGFLSAIDEDSYILSSYTPSGYEDGFIWGKIENIYRVDSDGKYEKKMLCLIHSHEKTVSPLSAFSEKNNLCELLTLSLEKGAFVMIELLDSGYDDVCGIVKSIESDACCITSIDEYGDYDGECVVGFSDISQVAYNSEEGKKRMILYQNRNN